VTARVRLLGRVAGMDGGLGDVVEVEVDRARRLVQTGAAERVADVRVRGLRTFASPDVALRPGRAVTVGGDVAAQLLADGLAELVEAGRA
jgi:hypothetical protein